MINTPIKTAIRSRLKTISVAQVLESGTACARGFAIATHEGGGLICGFR
jgi:hypothetical protein